MVTEINIDSHKLMFHPERVAEWKIKGDTAPIYIEIGLTNICNHRCTFCGLDWARGHDTLDTEILLKNIEDMARFGIRSICFSGAGEPLLHKDFVEIVKKTKEFGIDVSFSTNTVLFDSKKAEQVLPYVSWIRFSIDAGSPETHSKIHGTSSEDFKKILENLKNAVEIKKKNNYDVVLGVQFLLLEENMHELLKFVEVCKEIGVDNVQIKPYSQNPNSINQMKIDYSRFKDLGDEVKRFSTDSFKVIYRSTRAMNIEKGHDYKECFGLPFFAIINEQGEVVPCHQYYGMPEFSFGNINEDIFSDIWKSKERQDVIKLLKERGVQECKKGCRLHEINRYLYRLKYPDSHDNFI